MAKALRSDKKPIPPIHSTLGLVFSDDEKADAFADSLELQCRPNIVDADLDHIEQIEHEVEIILSGQDDTPMTPASPEEVRGIIGSLKVKKAPGPDKIPNSIEGIAGQSCRCFDGNNQRQPAILPLSFPMEKCECHFHPQARERFTLSPKLSPHKSNIECRKSSRKNHSDPAGQSDQ
jgi:hypothetical protein